LIANGLNEDRVHFVSHTGMLIEDLANPEIAATEV